MSSVRVFELEVKPGVSIIVDWEKGKGFVVVTREKIGRTVHEIDRRSYAGESSAIAAAKRRHKKLAGGAKKRNPGKRFSAISWSTTKVAPGKYTGRVYGVQHGKPSVTLATVQGKTRAQAVSAVKKKTLAFRRHNNPSEGYRVDPHAKTLMHVDNTEAPKKKTTESSGSAVAQNLPAMKNPFKSREEVRRNIAATRDEAQGHADATGKPVHILKQSPHTGYRGVPGYRIIADSTWQAHKDKKHYKGCLVETVKPKTMRNPMNTGGLTTAEREMLAGYKQRVVELRQKVRELEQKEHKAAEHLRKSPTSGPAKIRFVDALKKTNKVRGDLGSAVLKRDKIVEKVEKAAKGAQKHTTKSNPESLYVVRSKPRLASGLVPRATKDHASHWPKKKEVSASSLRKAAAKVSSGSLELVNAGKNWAVYASSMKAYYVEKVK